MIHESLAGVPAEIWYGIGMLVIAAVSFAVGYYLALQRTGATGLEAVEGLEGGEGFETSAYGPGEEAGFLETYKRERQKRKALSKGMYRWHLAGANFSQPKFVKPEREEGGNIPELEYEGETYLFPDDATVPSEEEGVPVVVHRRGESEPVNLRDSWDEALDAGVLTEYLTLRVTSKKPKDSLLGGLFGDSYDPMTVFRYGLLALVGFAILMETMGGGLW